MSRVSCACVGLALALALLAAGGSVAQTQDAQPPAQAAPQPPVPVRVVYARPRTFFSIAIGIVAFFLFPDSLRLVTRLLLGWDIFVTCYLVLACIMMFRCGLAHIRRSAILQDDGRFLILLVTALGAFASIAGDFPDWDLEIYGVGPLHEPLAGLIKELAPGRIHLRGFVSDSYAVLSDADLFVSSSWVEGFGNAIWEALACGVPVVAMDCGLPVRSLVREGVDGLIVTGGISELASALASLMSDGARRKALAERAPGVVTRYSLESSLNAWEALLNDVLGQSKVTGMFV
jgi:hypothetical protein